MSVYGFIPRAFGVGYTFWESCKPSELHGLKPVIIQVCHTLPTPTQPVQLMSAEAYPELEG